MDSYEDILERGYNHGKRRWKGGLAADTYMKLGSLYLISSKSNTGFASMLSIREYLDPKLLGC